MASITKKTNLSRNAEVFRIFTGEDHFTGAGVFTGTVAFTGGGTPPLQ